jgi:signal transduction histidine kinase
MSFSRINKILVDINKVEYELESGGLTQREIKQLEDDLDTLYIELDDLKREMREDSRED